MAILPQGQNKKEKDEMLRRKPELAVEENKDRRKRGKRAMGAHRKIAKTRQKGKWYFQEKRTSAKTQRAGESKIAE